jgi:hypothetical protein
MDRDQADASVWAAPVRKGLSSIVTSSVMSLRIFNSEKIVSFRIGYLVERNRLIS